MKEDYGNKKIFAENFNKMLLLKDVTCADVARGIGVAPSSVHGWVHQKTYPSIGTVEKLAAYFNCKKSELIEKDKKEETIYAYSLSREEYILIQGYRSADNTTKQMIERLLGYSELERKKNYEYYQNKEQSLQNPGNDKRTE